MQNSHYSSATLLGNNGDGRSDRDCCPHCGQRTDSTLAVREVAVWVHRASHQVVVYPVDHRILRFLDGWESPCGAHYVEWQRMGDGARVRRLLEVALSLGLEGFSLSAVVREFHHITEFRASGDKSAAMRHAFTLAEKSAEPVDTTHTTTAPFTSPKSGSGQTNGRADSH